MTWILGLINKRPNKGSLADVYIADFEIAFDNVQDCRSIKKI